MVTDRQLVCEKLRHARQEAELKQETVARYLKISTSAVSAFESGNRKLDAMELYMLAKLYKKPMEWFFSDYVSLQMISNQESLSAVSDPLINQCLKLLEQAPQSRRKAAAYGLLGFLGPEKPA